MLWVHIGSISKRCFQCVPTTNALMKMQEKYKIFFEMKKVLSRGYKNVEYLFSSDDAPIMICITILKQFSARTITCNYFAFYIQYFTVSNVKRPHYI